MAIQSKFLAMLGTSKAKSIIFLFGETAADSKRPLGLNASFNS